MAPAYPHATWVAVYPAFLNTDVAFGKFESSMMPYESRRSYMKSNVLMTGLNFLEVYIFVKLINFIISQNSINKN